MNNQVRNDNATKRQKGLTASHLYTQLEPCIDLGLRKKKSST